MAARQLIFGLLSDLQYWDGDVFKDRHFRNSLQKLESCQRVFNREQLDFVINLGDIIDREWKSYETILPAFSNFNCPVFHVLGNHDYEVDDRLKDQVPGRIDLTQNYYSFRQKDYRFIVLDGNEISTFANLQGSENYLTAEKWLHALEMNDRPNANFWNGGISKTQLAWLEQELRYAAAEQKWVIIFCHYPIFPDNRHNLLNSQEVLDLLQQYNRTLAWFCGHNHDGNYGKKSGIHFVNINGMVETEQEPAFCIVEITEQMIEIAGFGREPSRKLYLH